MFTEASPVLWSTSTRVLERRLMSWITCCCCFSLFLSGRKQQATQASESEVATITITCCSILLVLLLVYIYIYILYKLLFIQHSHPSERLAARGGLMSWITCCSMLLVLSLVCVYIYIYMYIV